jgi:hypothetical protein
MADNNRPHPQMPRPLGTFEGEKKHPSQGGNAYSQDMCEDFITRFQFGLPMNTPELTALCDEYQYPSVWTCRCHIQQFLEEGHD